MAQTPPLREILLIIAGLAAAGTMIELALIGHWHGPFQLIPWAVAYSTIAAAWATAPPTNRTRLHVARILATTNIAACVYGSYLHLDANYQIAAEVNPAASTANLLGRAAQGRIPLLAPLFFTLPCLLIILATWRHPEVQPTEPTAAQPTKRDPGAAMTPLASGNRRGRLSLANPGADQILTKTSKTHVDHDEGRTCG